jgi:hypothetical protein
MPHPFAVAKIQLAAIDATQFQNDATKSALKVFLANAERCMSLARMPSVAFQLGMYWSLSIIKAEKDYAHDRGISRGSFSDSDWDEVNRMALNEARLRLAGPAKDLTRTPESFYQMVHETANSYMAISEVFEHDNSSEVQHVLGAILVSAWACIEVLAEQLYLGAEAAAPSKFPKFKNDKNRSNGIGFRSRKKIRQSFKEGFGEPSLDNILESKNIDALALMRNVIVHNAAHSDTDFHDGLSSAAPHLDMYLPLKSSPGAVVITGELALSLVDLSFKSCCDLLTATDAWITKWKP